MCTTGQWWWGQVGSALPADHDSIWLSYQYLAYDMHCVADTDRRRTFACDESFIHKSHVLYTILGVVFASRVKLYVPQGSRLLG